MFVIVYCVCIQMGAQNAFYSNFSDDSFSSFSTGIQYKISVYLILKTNVSLLLVLCFCETFLSCSVSVEHLRPTSWLRMLCFHTSPKDKRSSPSKSQECSCWFPQQAVFPYLVDYVTYLSTPLIWPCARLN